MEKLIIDRIKSEINRFDEILAMEDKNNLTLQEYKKRYEIIKEYLENFLIDIEKIIKNPVVIKKYKEMKNESSNKQRIC